MFDNMSVKTRLFSLVALLLALMITMGVMGLVRMAQVQEHLRTVYEDRTIPLVQLATVVEAQNRIRYRVVEAAANEDAAQRGAALADIPALAETINTTWKEYRATYLTPEEKQLGDEWEGLRKAFIGERDKVMGMIKADQIIEARAAIPAFTEAYTRSRTVMEKLTKLQADVAKQEFDGAVQEYQRARLVSSIATLVAALLGLVVAWKVVASIVGPLRRAVDAAGHVAAGDLGKAVDTSGAGAELGQLLQAMARMQQALRDMIAQIKNDADSLASTAAALAQSSEEVARASGIQSEASSSIAAAVEEMTVSISHIASRTDDTRTVSSQAGELAQSGESVTARTGDSVRQIAHSVTTTSNQIEQLSQKINQISAVVNVIKDIADQTNLLALNAAIEAARAGEQGRGFAVVADEVRKLAERTSQSTGEISSVIGQILEAAASSVTQMRESVHQVNAGVALSEEAGATIARINAIEAQVVDAVNEIATALKEQSAASTDIAQQVERIAQAAEENNAAVSATAESSQTVSTLGSSLQQAVARFRV